MSVYLEAVAQAREDRDAVAHVSDEAQRRFVAALTLACEHHSLRVVAAYAGISFSGVKHLVDGARDA